MRLGCLPAHRSGGILSTGALQTCAAGPYVIWGAWLQLIQDGFQHEQPDYWLNFGNPWEIERLNVGYTIKFYGHVSVHEDGGRQVFKWNPGESVSAPDSCPLGGFVLRGTAYLGEPLGS